MNLHAPVIHVTRNVALKFPPIVAVLTIIAIMELSRILVVCAIIAHHVAVGRIETDVRSVVELGAKSTEFVQNVASPNAAVCIVRADTQCVLKSVPHRPILIILLNPRHHLRNPRRR